MAFGEAFGDWVKMSVERTSRNWSNLWIMYVQSLAKGYAFSSPPKKKSRKTITTNNFKRQ